MNSLNRPTLSCPNLTVVSAIGTQHERPMSQSGGTTTTILLSSTSNSPLIWETQLWWASFSLVTTSSQLQEQFVSKIAPCHGTIPLSMFLTCADTTVAVSANEGYFWTLSFAMFLSPNGTHSFAKFGPFPTTFRSQGVSSMSVWNETSKVSFCVVSPLYGTINFTDGSGKSFAIWREPFNLTREAREDSGVYWVLTTSSPPPVIPLALEAVSPTHKGKFHYPLELP